MARKWAQSEVRDEYEGGEPYKPRWMSTPGAYGQITDYGGQVASISLASMFLAAVHLGWLPDVFKADGPVLSS